MSIFKRALVQVRANIGKSLLIFLIFTMTMGAISATFMVTQMYTKTVNEVFKDGEVPILIYPKEDVSLFGGAVGAFSSEDEYKVITPTQYKEIANLENVTNIDTDVYMTLKDGQLELPESLSNSEMMYSLGIQFDDDPTSIGRYYGDGVYKFDYDKDMYKSDPNSIILNNEILEANNLEIGDKIILDLNAAYSEQEEISDLKGQELTIAGSYSVKPTQQMIDDQKAMAEEYGYEADTTFADLKTYVLMPKVKGEELVEIYGDAQDAINVSSTYTLASLDSLDPFKKDVENLLGYPIESEFAFEDDEMTEKAMSISTLSYFKWFLVRLIKFIIAVIVVLLTVIITLFVRGRKKEIGILVALGESKRNIYGQLLIEQFIVLAIATIIEYPFVLFYLNSMFKKQTGLSVGFDVTALGLSIIAGVLLVGIITIIPAIYTLRVKPKKILL